MNFYERLKDECKSRNLKVTPLVIECGGSSGSIAGWKKGAYPNSGIVINLANKLNISADYLLGLTDLKRPVISDGVHDSVIGNIGGNIGGSVTVNGDKLHHLSTQEQDLLRIYNSLSSKLQMQLMQSAFDCEDEMMKKE